MFVNGTIPDPRHLHQSPGLLVLPHVQLVRVMEECANETQEIL